MNRRGLLAVGVAVAAVATAAAAVAAQGAAGAATAAPAGVTMSAAGGIAGVVPPVGERQAATRFAAARALASCTEPDCDVAYHRGPVQLDPRVYVVFWGPKWVSAAAQGAVSYLTSFYKGLGQATDTWSLTTGQYGDSSGHPSFGTSVLRGTYVDKTAPPKTPTYAQLTDEATAVAKHFKITDPLDTQVVIAAQSGTCFGADFGQQFVGNCGKVPATPPASSYCGWHSDVAFGNSYLTFVNLPYQPDAGSYCGANLINSGPVGVYDGFSMVGGHEYAESITDPVVNTGWEDLADDVSGGEIADKCAWGGSAFGLTDPEGDITLSTGTFAMQSLWSNVTDSCIMSGKLPFKVTPLGNQSATIGRPVSLQVSAATTPAAPLTYTASGLPGGLSIGKTGKITGKPDVTAGTVTTTVRVAYYAKSFAFRFTWRVSSLPAQVRGYDGKCAQDAGGVVKNGNPIEIWTCDATAPQQQITFTDSGELQVLGDCITGGTKASLAACAGTKNQLWTRQHNGEYVLKLNGECLTDPASATKNGTLVTLAACKNTANQHWSLP